MKDKNLITVLIVIAVILLGLNGVGIFMAVNKSPRKTADEVDSDWDEDFDKKDRNKNKSEAKKKENETSVLSTEEETVEKEDDYYTIYADIIEKVTKEEAGYLLDEDLVNETRSNNGNITYSYAFCEISGDNIPELLISASSDYLSYSGLSYITIYSYQGEGKLYRCDETLYEGVAGAGGFRGGISLLRDTYGLYLLSWSSGSGEGEGYRYYVEGNQLKSELIERFSMYEENDNPSPETEEINWTEI